MYPDNVKSREVFDIFFPSFYFYITEVGTSAINGYTVTKSEVLFREFFFFAAVNIYHQLSYQAIPYWKVSFPNNETIAAVAGRDSEGFLIFSIRLLILKLPFEASVSSLGRVLGNRKVLYKYLNPNLLAVATTQSSLSKTSLFIYLVDTVTGSIHHRSLYHGAGQISSYGPSSVYLIQSDNFVVASFFNHGPGAVETATINENEPEEIFDETTAEGRKRKRRAERKRKQMMNESKDVASNDNKSQDVKGYEVAVLEIYESIKPDTRMKS